MGYYDNTRDEVLTYIDFPVVRALDVGCGYGRFSRELKAKTNAETWGVDINQEAADVASQYLDRVIKGSLDEVTNACPRLYFDLIVFNDVLEHMENPEDALIQSRSLLAQNGKILISVPNVRYFHHLKELLIERDWEYKDSGILDRTHLRFFTEKSISRLVNHTGYRISKIRGINPTKSKKFHLLNTLLLKSLSDTMYLQWLLIAEKKQVDYG